MFAEVVKEIVAIVGGAAVLAGVLAWLTKGLLTHWMDKALAQHKANLDAESANAIERLRSDLKQQTLEHEVRYRRNDAEIAERLNGTYVRLFDFYRRVCSLVKVIEWSDEASKVEKLDSTDEANKEFWDYFLKNRLYVPRGLFRKTKAFADNLVRITNEYVRNLRREHEGREPEPDFWSKTMTEANDQAGQVFSALVDDFQKRLGVFEEEPGEPVVNVEPDAGAIENVPPTGPHA